MATSADRVISNHPHPDIPPGGAAAALQDGRTPMHLVAKTGHLEVVRQLLGAGALADAADEVGPPPHMMDASSAVAWQLPGHGVLLSLWGYQRCETPTSWSRYDADL
jgi:ankyrin repeat protein